MNRRQAATAALASCLAAATATLLAACGDGGSAQSKDDDDKPTTTVAVPATTRESIIGDTVPQSTTTTSTTEAVGLPSGLGIPPASTLTLGGNSSLTSSVTVRGVPLDEVVAFVRADLAGLGWAVDDDLSFTGPGAAGQATVTDDAGVVEIRIVLSALPR